MGSSSRLDRRNLIRIGARGTAVAAGTAALAGPLVFADDTKPAPSPSAHDHQGGTTAETEHGGHDHNSTVGDIDIARLGWDPADVLTDFDYGTVTETRADGTAVREWRIAAYDKEIEIAPGVFFPAWTYNGRVPGPTLRANEGDLLASTSPTPDRTRIRCTSTASTARTMTG